MVLKYHISSYPALLESMWARIYEADSGGLVYEEEIVERDINGDPDPGGGHQVPYTVTANGLDKVVHIVRLYTNGGILLHQYNAEPKVDIVTVFNPIRFIIGDGGLYTPLAGTSSFQHPNLVGLTTDEFIVHRNGVGELHPETHYTFTPGTGEIVLSQIGDVWNGSDGTYDQVTIRLKPSVVSTVVNDSVVGKWFGGFVDISASRDYLSSDLRKLLRFSGSPTYTFPALGAIPIGYIFVFTNFGTASGVGVVQFLNAPLKWKNTTKTTFNVGEYCEAAFVFDGAQWNVVYITTSAASLGGDVPNYYPIKAGETYIGDVAVNDPVYPISHNANIAGNYTVMISIKTPVGGNRINNNLICGSWMHNVADKPNKFDFTPQQIDNVANSMELCWLLIKLP